MKKILTFFVTLCFVFVGLFTLTACGGKDPEPQKLSSPVVTLSENVASWSEVENADKFEISVDGTLSYVESSVTKKTLANGQTLKVRAVGDGINYLTGDWSNSVTYTAREPDPQPEKLGVPTVTISASGLASWSAVANASGYAYKINGGAENRTSATSVQLTNGQTIVVKAIGDGTNYLDGDYSSAKTYTQSNPSETTAPSYLGIIASNQEPARDSAPSDLIRTLSAYGTRISLDDALANYYADANNALGESAPTESEYEVYSSIGSTVYVQIWLDNPDQNTILSLKLNGTKYQSGGALQSFFIESGNTYLNCVYVAIEIPANNYEEISYEVTEIEYVEGNNVSQDGKAVMVDENNDTVIIGLPYEQAMPTVTISNANATATSVSFDVTVMDEDNFVNLIGGWLRVVIYNQNNQILGQQKLANGDNVVTFNNLSADTYYNVMAFVLGDIHNGNGVCVHSLGNQSCKTEGVISATFTSNVLQNEQTGKYYPVIDVTAELFDNSFTFTKVEICDWSGEIYYTSDFNGSISITENILNGQSYVVKVYYENVSGVEQSYYDSVYVDRLDYPWVLEPCLQYGLIDDAILGFDFGDNKSNFENLTIRIIDEYSKQYLAENAIYLIENPNAVEELMAQWQSMSRDNPDFLTVYDRWYKLDQAQGKINDYYPNVEKAEWQAELAKGIYCYEYVYGQDEQFFKVGNKYYVVLNAYQSQRINDYSWKYILFADFDLNDGAGIEEDRTIIDGWFDIEPAISKNDYLFAEEFSLNDENVVYLETKSRNNLGNESYRELGYVNQIVLADGYDILQVLWSQDEPEHDIDEGVWMQNVINALKAGNDVQSVFPLGEMQPITFDLDDIEFNSDIVGNYSIRYTYVMYGKTYTEESPYNWDGQVIDYTLKGVLPQVTIDFATGVEQFGMWRISSPDWVKNGVWNFAYSIEVRDENQQLVGTYNQDNYGEYERLPLNYSIRIRLDSYAGADYYTQGEWSDWFTCLSIPLSVPNNFTQSYEVDCAKVEWSWVDGAEKYLYTVNGGEEKETTETFVSGLNNGDKLRVKALPADGSYYCDSAYSEVYTVIDTRTPLSTPTNIRVQDKVLWWSAVENATYYQIEYIRNEQVFVECSDSPDFYYYIAIGTQYRIRACSEDVENYKASEWSGNFTYTVTLENPTFNQVRRERVYWNSVENAGGYNYKIGENGDIVDNGRTLYVSLSEIPVGEKLYVQAYATGCESTQWVMIYHNVVALATPVVTITGEVASWDAIENATGYKYKINDGEESYTIETSFTGLDEGDTITVCATSTTLGFTNSEWSEVKRRPATMPAPVLNTEYLESFGYIEWMMIVGAEYYIVEVDGVENTCYDNKYYDLQFDSTIRVRAVCNSGEYEQFGIWSEYFTYVDTRTPFAVPNIAFDFESGLTVTVEDGVDYYVYKFGQNGIESTYYVPDGCEGEVITIMQSVTFADGDDYTIYLKAVPKDSINFKESEWATVTVNF